MHQTQICSIVLALVCGYSSARHCPNVAHSQSRSVSSPAARVSPFADICRSAVSLYLDLHDVHTLQNNLFGFLHHVVQGLRKKGVRRIPFGFLFTSSRAARSLTRCDRYRSGQPTISVSRWPRCASSEHSLPRSLRVKSMKSKSS